MIATIKEGGIDLKGIDLSGYNKVTDYTAVAKSIDFAILKVIRKDLSADSLFETHWKGFESNNVPIQGVYNYSYATNVQKAKTDAMRVLQILGDRKPMVWLDIEDACLTKIGHGLIDVIRAYADIIRSAGLQFGIYTYLAFYNSYLRQYANELDYPFWVARYPSKDKMTLDKAPDATRKPEINKEVYGWQYSSTGKVNGIVGDVDLDEWFVEIEAKDTKKTLESDKIADAFRMDMAQALGKPLATTAKGLINYTVTVSATKNKNHSTVTALERFLKAKGYYNGSIEADQGKKPIFGNGMAKATALFQTEIVGLKKADNEWTSKGKSYQTALGLR